MNELTLVNDFTKMWQKTEIVNQIRESFAPSLNDMEFKTLVEMGKATGLNPFLKQIWAIKYGNKAAQIFLGRDGYRVSIGRNPNYQSHIVDAVYENDDFSVDLVNGQVSHKYKLSKRGKLVGAYCLVWMKSAPRPYYVFCDFEEYNLKQSLWLTKPATMIKKVAEAQCIRMALPNIYAGTYDECEMPKQPKNEPTANPNLSTESVHNKMDAKTKTENVKPFIDKIDDCETEDQLRSVGSEIKDEALSDQDKRQLSNVYREKLQDLKQKQQEEPEMCEEAKEFFNETEGAQI